MRVQKVLSEGSSFDNVSLCFFYFLVDEGIKDPNTTIMRHQRPASETPLKWRFTGGPMMAQHLITGLVALRFSIGSGPVFLRNPIFLLFFFFFFGGGGGGGERTACPSSGSAHDQNENSLNAN